MEGAEGGMLAALVEALSWILLLGGSFFYVVGMIGLNRMPDVFTRMHAVSVSDTLGLGMLIFGMMLQAGFTLVTLKLLFILALIFVAGPVTSHALARAALHDGRKPLLENDEGELVETDLRVAFPALRDRLGEPLSSETVVETPEHPEPQGGAPSNS